MSLPATEPDSPATARGTDRDFLLALGWATAGAVCAGGAWVVGVILARFILDLHNLTATFSRLAADGVPLLIGAGAISGLLAGVIAGLIRRTADHVTHTMQLALVGILTGSIGSGLSVATALVCDRWVHPLVSSSFVWAFVGLHVGLCGYVSTTTPRFRLHAAVLWAFTGAACAGGIWAGVLLAARTLFDTSVVPNSPSDTVVGTIILAVLGAAYGLPTGVVMGFLRGGSRRIESALALGFGGLLFGALGGGLSILVVMVGGSRVNPIVSSALVWSGIGFLMGLWSYLWSQWTAAPSEPTDEEDDSPQQKIEWVLRERKQRWRDVPLVRVLPVLLVSLASLIGAAIFAASELSMGLLAVGALGFAAAFVLYNQERRLRALEQRFRQKRES
jgi:hypothetical protein